MHERTPAELVAHIEALGAELGFPVIDLCRRAGISRATWQRVKAGKEDIWLKTLRSLQTLASDLEAEKKRGRK
jgi:hypothetical protein